MRKFLAVLIVISLLTRCNSLQDEPPSNGDRFEVPEPDKDLRLKYEALQKLKESGCLLSTPDTSLAGIKLRDSESAVSVLGEGDKSDSAGQYHFYSRTHGETLTLTQHPGDGKHQISIFRVDRSAKADRGYRQLPVKSFETGKGIKLGLPKKDIVDRLGDCYAALDSTNGYIELYYKIESPNDSKTGLLRSHNMPVYYASYGLRNDRLETFEFGFEYP